MKNEARKSNNTALISLNQTGGFIFVAYENILENNGTKCNDTWLGYKKFHLLEGEDEKICTEYFFLDKTFTTKPD
tara:strand:+ start:2714 stop:2938 length:225 start_codon:yes stop_codon:yes gene_type:complete